MQNLRSEYIYLKRKWNIMLQQYTKQVLQWKVKFLLQFHEFVYNKLLVIFCGCWFIYAFIPMLSRLFTHSFIRWSIRLFVVLFVHVLFCPFIHLSSYSLIHCLYWFVLSCFTPFLSIGCFIHFHNNLFLISLLIHLFFIYLHIH